VHSIVLKSLTVYGNKQIKKILWIRYANNSNYKNDTMIRKEAYVHSAVMDELRRIIEDSEIMAEVCRNYTYLFIQNAIRHILVNW
jgi:hypothetical protein